MLTSIGVIDSASNLQPIIITYSIGAGGAFGNGSQNGSNGGSSSLTIGGETLIANGGNGGQLNNNVAGTGGTVYGGNFNIRGGHGSGASGDAGGGGGGGIGGVNASTNPGGAGRAGAQSSDVNGLFAILSGLSISTTSVGAGGTSAYALNVAHGGNATGFGCGGGGGGFWGGKGGDGLYGGGGGGASGYSNTLSGGNGGAGAIVLSFTGGTPSSVLLTSGTSYTVPAGTTAVTAWVIGGGGGGGGVPPGDGLSSGGGGAGGVASKTWNIVNGIVVIVPAPSPFVPTQLPNLKAWYDMSTLGLANGATVDTITDSSGNGFHLSAAAAPAPRGTYVLSDPNFAGKSTVTGSWTYRRNYTANTFIQGNESFTIYVVAKITSYVDQVVYGMFFGFGANNSLQSAIFTRASYVASSGGYYVDFVNAGAGGSYSSPIDTKYIFQYSYGGGDRGIYPMFQNNVAHSTSPAGSPLYIASSGEIAMGGKPQYGWSCIGTIAEVIVYKDYHEPATIATVRNYLNAKYSVF